MIPKIIHQMWIGPKVPPFNMMLSWNSRNPDYEYIFWTESEILQRNITFKCCSQIDSIKEWNGKCDIMRWEILLKYGGIFIDADSFCIEPLGDVFLNNDGFAAYENEKERKGLVATGTMGFPPNSKLCRDIVDWIFNYDDDAKLLMSSTPAWYSLGPGCLTRFLNTGNYKSFSVYPSYLFTPIHHTHSAYNGHKKVYGHQVWCTSNDSYDSFVNCISIPPVLLTQPELKVSVLVSSYNTKREYIKECLNSIVNQEGSFFIELVWCNDGSDEEHSLQLEEELENAYQSSRFLSIRYDRTLENFGIPECLAKGVKMCSNELIFTIDSDDVMVLNRISIQLNFMLNNPQVQILGGSICCFTENGMTKVVEHNSEIKWSDFIELEHKPNWIMNHPTLCYRRSAIIEIGNYNKNFYSDNFMHDYDLELRIMKKFGSIHNLSDVLTYYRIHDGQLSGKKSSEETMTLMEQILKNVI